MTERIVKLEKTLESGKKVRIFKGTAYDMVKAQMMVSSPMEAQLGLAAILCEVDGQMISFEEWKNMDLDDYLEVLPFLLGNS
jgi:hypothetical protein